MTLFDLKMDWLELFAYRYYVFSPYLVEVESSVVDVLSSVVLVEGSVVEVDSSVLDVLSSVVVVEGSVVL